jgi:hypothetical protein
LASYIWKETSVVAHKLRGNDTLSYNITRQFDGTDRDDLTIFCEDGTFLFEEGQTKHTAQSSEKYYTGTWQLTGDGRKLTLNTSKAGDEYQILRLDSTTMVLKLSVTHQKAPITICLPTWLHQNQLLASNGNGWRNIVYIQK